jgi:cholesterol transport system auxiliary component
MNLWCFVRLFWFSAAGLALTLNAGCGALFAKAAVQPSFYTLDSAPAAPRAATSSVSQVMTAAPTLIINPPSAASGFDSRHIIYVRGSHTHEYFSHSEWVDTPARMLAPLIVAAIEKGGAFRAVLLSPSVAAADFRLDTEIMRLEQDFVDQPSRVRFTLRAYVVDDATRRVIAWREFDETVAAASEDPYGGVVAANRAVQIVLEELADFCAKAVGSWQSPGPKR